MSAHVRLEVRTLIRALELQVGDGDPLVGALNDLIEQKWTTQVVNGQTVISTAEAGGSVTFTFERSYTPVQIANMAEEALEWLNTGGNAAKPDIDVARYNRIHPTFHKAVL